MKLCYGLLASGKQEQCDNLIQLLNVNGNQIVIQIDAKSEPLYQFLYNKYKDDKNIHFAQNRFDVYWGGITTTTATLNLMRETLSLDYDYFTMVSESCLPLYPDEEIKAFFERHKGTEFIDVRFDWTKRSRLHLDHSKPYTAWQRKHRNILAFRDVVCDTLFGWAIGKNKQFKSWKVPTTLLWYSITKDCLKYLVETIDNNHLVEKYQNTLIADEHIWAEVLLSSPYYDKLFIKGKRGGALLYCDWYTLNAPRLLTMKDYKKIYNPKYPCLYARKFDLKTEPEVVLKIYENRKNPDFKCKFE